MSPGLLLLLQVAGIKEHNNKVACVTAAFIQAKQYLIASAGDIANELHADAHDPVTGLARVTFHALLHQPRTLSQRTARCLSRTLTN